MKRSMSIYGYTDYRQYLADYYEFRKSSSRGYSFRSFSRESGFTAPNVMKLVIDGQRNIGLRSIDKFIVGLHLEGKEADYFRTLVELNNSHDDQEKRELLVKLQRLTPASKRRFLSAESVEYLSSWVYPTLREMVTTGHFKDDPYWLSRRLTGRTSITELAKAIGFLKQNGFIVRNERGFEAQDAMVLSSDEIKSLAIREYHRSCLKQAQEMLEDLDIHEREYGSLTVHLSAERMQELKEKLKEFRSELHQWAMQDGDVMPESDRSHIVQINFQMYPQTRKVKST